MLGFVLWALPTYGAELVFEGRDARMTAEVVDAAPMMRNAQVMLKFRLSEASTADFADFTDALIGEELSISLCDQVLVRTTVQERIASGHGLITMVDDDTAFVMAEVLRGEAECSALEPTLGN